MIKRPKLSTARLNHLPRNLDGAVLRLSVARRPVGYYVVTRFVQSR
jgi:hypothetical protein